MNGDTIKPKLLFDLFLQLDVSYRIESFFRENRKASEMLKAAKKKKKTQLSTRSMLLTCSYILKNWQIDLKL